MNYLSINSNLNNFISEIEKECDKKDLNSASLSSIQKATDDMYTKIRVEIEVAELQGTEVEPLDSKTFQRFEALYKKMGQLANQDWYARQPFQVMQKLDKLIKSSPLCTKKELSSKDLRKEEEKRTGRKYMGSAVVLSLGGSQIVGSLAAVANLVMGIWNSVSAARAKWQQMSLTRSIEKHQVLALQHPGDKKIQEELKRLKDLMNGKERAMHQSVEGLKENARHFVASIISLVPLVGVIGAGAFLNATTKEGDAKSPTSAERGAEEMMKGLGSALGPVARGCIYPLGGKGQTFKAYCEEQAQERNKYYSQYGAALVSATFVENDYQDKMQALGAQEVRVSVDRGDGKEHSIRCQFVNTKGDPTADTFVLFHGNGMIGEDMDDVAAFYKSQGKNIMMVTMGGYAGSDEQVATSEVSTIQDVNAVLKHLEKQGVKSIGVHGHSIGGSLAMHATQLSDKVKFCCIDKSFDSVRNVAANLISNLSQQAPILKIAPKAVIRGLVASGFPTQQPVPGVTYKDGKPYRTDGCDNLSKVDKYQGVLVTISGTQDHFMGYAAEGDEFAEAFPHDMHIMHASKNKGKSFDQFIETGHTPDIRDARGTLTAGLQAAF